MTHRPYVTLALSDVHLGHPNTPTEFILANIDKYILTDENVAKADRVIIVGDLFDRPLYWPMGIITPIQRWMLSKLHQCAKYKTQLRCLEGTPRHDRGQTGGFTFMNEIAKHACDFAHYADIAVEIDPATGHTFLYVPDEYRSTTAETLILVREALAEKGLTQVDYAYMHGFFDKQVPACVDAHSHEQYSQLVTTAIFCGHDHVAKTYEKLYIQGSSDRLSFGEEGDKGGWLVDVTPTAVNSTFLINQGAAMYRYFICTGRTESEFLRFAEEVAVNPPAVAYCRLRMNDPNQQLPWLRTARKLYPSITWDHDVIADKVDDLTQITSPAISLNLNTLPAIVAHRLKQMDVDSELTEQCLAYVDAITQDTPS